MKHDYNSLSDIYKKDGFVIVDDFLPEEIADKLEIMWSGENNKWEYFEQVRDQGYNKGKYGKHYTKSSYFPGAEEEYSARFWRSSKLEAETSNIFDEYFKPALKFISQLELSEHDVRCYKLDEGCHYRSHIDDWGGEIGCIYYINKKWIWDWGGILNVGMDDGGDQLIPMFPKFNRAIFISHGGFRFPHFISPVTEWALDTRFTMFSINK